MAPARDYVTHYRETEHEDSELEAVYAALDTRDEQLALTAFDLDFFKRADHQQATDVLKAVHQAIHQLDESERRTAAEQYAHQIFSPIATGVQERLTNPDDRINQGNADYRRTIINTAVLSAEHALARGMASAEHNPDNLTLNVQRAVRWAEPNAILDPLTEDLAARHYANVKIHQEHARLTDHIVQQRPEERHHHSNREFTYQDILRVRARDACENRSLDFNEDHVVSIIESAAQDADLLIRAYDGQAVYSQPDGHQPIEFPAYGSPPQDLTNYLKQITAAYPQMVRDWPQLTRSTMLFAGQAGSHGDLIAARNQAAVMHAMAYGGDPTRADGADNAPQDS